jgi:signal transduction histidine kinase
MSLRLRLTFLAGSVLAITLVVYYVFTYFIISRAIYGEIDQALEAQAREVFSLLQIRSSPKGIEIWIPPQYSNVFAQSGNFVQFIGSKGDVIARSTSLGDEHLPRGAEILERAREGDAFIETIATHGTSLRIYHHPYVAQGSLLGILQVARSLSDVETGLRQLRFTIVIGGGITIIAAMGLAFLIAHAGLLPLERLALAAQLIGQTQDISKRVPQAGANDEVGRLAKTFNTMLDRLQSSYARIAEALAAQRRLVADASHELRTPLTVIRGNVALLRDIPDLSDDERKAALNDIAVESERMSRLVSDMLALARADAGRTIRQEWVDLNAIAADVCRQAPYFNSMVAVQLNASDGKASVKGDPDLLRQLILILLDNALKYTPAGGSVTVSTESKPRAVHLIVEDTGIGMRQADIASAFDRFYQADKARHSGGFGLGLSIAKWIVEAHGADLDITSAPEQGTTVTVTLHLSVMEASGQHDGPIGIEESLGSSLSEVSEEDVSVTRSSTSQVPD